jgi:hypothetical protein
MSSTQPRQVYVPMCSAAGGGNTPCTSEGYYHAQLCGTMAHKLCCNASKSTNEASTPTRGGDAFGTRLAKNRWFGSSGLNLAFEGLLLGASLRLCAKVTRNEPHESCFQFMMLSFTQKEHLSSFARRRRCRRSPSGGCK